MSRAKLSTTIATAGFVTVAASVLMAFLVDHHWYVSYQIGLLFEGMWGWAQLLEERWQSVAPLEWHFALLTERHCAPA